MTGLSKSHFDNWLTTVGTWKVSNKTSLIDWSEKPYACKRLFYSWMQYICNNLAICQRIVQTASFCISLEKYFPGAVGVHSGRFSVIRQKLFHWSNLFSFWSYHLFRWTCVIVPWLSLCGFLLSRMKFRVGPDHRCRCNNQSTFCELVISKDPYFDFST